MNSGKRILSLCMSLLMIVPFFVNISINAFASSDSSNAGDYQPMSEQYAKAFIGFIYDKSEVTEDMMNAGDIYKFLTGGYEKGTEEELVAKIVFLESAQINLSKCTSKYSSMMDNSYNQLLSYFEKKASGSIDGGIANSALDNIIKSVAQVIVTLGGVGGSEIWEDVEFIMSTYNSVIGLPGKIQSVKKDVTALVNTFAYAWSSSRINMYKYLDLYITNKGCEDLLDDLEIGDLIDDVNSLNRMELVASGLYDPLLNWASEGHVAVLEYFGDFIYAVSKSLEIDLSTEKYTQNVKVVEVHCPTDVYLYNESDSLLLSVIADEVTRYSENVYALVLNSKKTIVVPADLNYSIRIIGTDVGFMNYQVSEYSDNAFMRSVKYENVPLEKGSEYTANVPQEIYAKAENYNLNTEFGEEIEYTYDSLPDFESDIVDVVVAEELFDGFSTELIDKVANAMFHLESSVDISSYQVSTDNIVALISAIQKYYPTEYTALTISDFSYKAIVSPTLGIVTKLRFYYGDDVDLSVVQKRAQDMKTEINKIVAQTEGMDDFEKALFVHDYLVLNAEYDLELLDMMENGQMTYEVRNERYTEYSILVNGTGVCGSYALAYRAVLNACGMDCLYVSSGAMNHAWNLIKVDGSWYHVDCTWDDPVPDTYGRARRTYFMLTDDEIMKLSHYSWTPTSYKATSSKYSDMPRNYDIYQKYDYGTDLWYNLSGSTLYTYDKYGDNQETIGRFSATSISVDSGNIYYSSGRYVYRYTAETGGSVLVYRIPNSKSGFNTSKAYIENMYVNNDMIEYYKHIYDADGKGSTVYEIALMTNEIIMGVELNTTKLSINVFDLDTLTATVTTLSGSSADVEFDWSSTNKSVATVDNGKISAKNVGTATITASLGLFSASCEVEVTGNGLSGLCGDNVQWSFVPETGILTISGNSAMYDYSISSAAPWRKMAETITSCVVIDDVSLIGNYAFYGCNALESISISKSVETINAYAFSGCTGLKTIIVNEKNSAYSSDEFDVLFNHDQTILIQYPIANSNEAYIVPDSVKEISAQAFSGNSFIQSVSISENVTSIAHDAFRNCSSLLKIIVSENNTCYYSDDEGILYDKTMHMILVYPIGKKQKTFVVPEGVITIGAYAFENADLASAVLPQSLMNINTYSFANCEQLEFMVIPENVIFIGSYAFANCKNLEYLIFTGIRIGQSSVTSHDIWINCAPMKVLITNPNFEIRDYFYNRDVVLYAHENSTVAEYAQRIGKPFVNIDDEDHDHDYFLVEYIEKTDNVDGYKKYICYCGESSYTNIDHHPGVPVVTEATCATNGAEIITCIICGEIVEEKILEKTGQHQYKLTYTVPGDCTTPPIETYTCSVCGDSYTKEGRIDDGHKYVETVINPTCTEKGYTKAVCSICGEMEIYDFTAPTGHKLTISSASDNCTAHGTLLYTCSRCDYAEYVAIDATNVATETVIEPATCTLTGLSKDICVLCGATISSRVLIAKGHTYRDEYTVDKAATCTEDGSKSRHCTVCDAKGYVTVIPATGHSFGEWVTVTEATCEIEGLEKRICKDGDAEETRVIPVIAHIDNDGNGICDTCKQALPGATPDDSGTTKVFRCKWCAKYELRKGSFFEPIYAFIHAIVHFFSQVFGTGWYIYE